MQRVIAAINPIVAAATPRITRSTLDLFAFDTGGLSVGEGNGDGDGDGDGEIIGGLKNG